MGPSSMHARGDIRRCLTWLTVIGCVELVSSADGSPCVFDGSTLHDKHHVKVSCADLAGKHVALYFAGEWCPLCRRFTPALREFHEKYKEEVALVFVTSDVSAKDAEQHFSGSQGDWLALAWGDPLVSDLKRKHRVWSGREIGEFGPLRRSGVPCVVVISRQGDEVSFIAGERYGAAALREWEPAGTAKWPDEL